MARAYGGMSLYMGGWFLGGFVVRAVEILWERDSLVATGPWNGHTNTSWAYKGSPRWGLDRGVPQAIQCPWSSVSGTISLLWWYRLVNPQWLGVDKCRCTGIVLYILLVGPIDWIEPQSNMRRVLGMFGRMLRGLSCRLPGVPILV